MISSIGSEAVIRIQTLMCRRYSFNKKTKGIKLSMPLVVLERIERVEDLEYCTDNLRMSID
jgi:hypothetical protein